MDTNLTLPGDLQTTVDAAIDEAVESEWASRIWDRDASLWTDDRQVEATIANRLGWLDGQLGLLSSKLDAMARHFRALQRAQLQLAG